MTEWFEREKGDSGPLMKVDEDGGVMVVSMYGSVPDWVCTPPELGSEKFRVTGKFRGQCPMCKERTVVHLEIDAPYGVAQCHDACGFVWYGGKSE